MLAFAGAWGDMTQPQADPSNKATLQRNTKDLMVALLPLFLFTLRTNPGARPKP